MKVAIVQNQPVFGDIKGNAERLLAMIASKSADLYILPELAFSGYQFVSKNEAISLAETVHGPTVALFRKAAREINACIVFGFPEISGNELYNSSLAVLPDGRDCLYRKTHLYYKETLWFSPGTTGFPVFEFEGARVGMAICFDWFFPESFRTLALGGADIIAHCSNLVMPYCQQADFAAAVQNRVYIATANRTGVEKREAESLTFTGGSVLVSPRGEYLLRASETEEAVLVSEIDPELARSKRINAINDVFAERRPEHYRL
jgi:predicted amidohydrolase